jgi:nucleotide-binding universal stress UspA family protein
MYKNILIACDDSEWTELSLEKAVELGRVWKSKIIAFHSVFNELKVLKTLNFPLIPGPLETNFFPTFDDDKIPEVISQLGSRVVERVTGILEKSGLEYKIELIEDLRPVEAAIELINKYKVDLVIVGAHGSGGTFGRIFLGSVAMRIANRVPVSTLIIRLPKKRRDELKKSL